MAKTKKKTPPPPRSDAPPENGADDRSSLIEDDRVKTLKTLNSLLVKQNVETRDNHRQALSKVEALVADQEAISNIEVAVASIVAGAKAVEEVRKVRREASTVEKLLGVKVAAFEEVLEDRNRLRKDVAGLEGKIVDLEVAVKDGNRALKEKGLEIERFVDECGQKETALEAEKRSLEVELGKVLGLFEDLKKENVKLVAAKEDEVQVMRLTIEGLERANEALQLKICSVQGELRWKMEEGLENCRRKDEALEQMRVLHARDLEEHRKRKLMLEGKKKLLEEELFSSSQSAEKVIKEMEELVSSKDEQLQSLHFRITELVTSNEGLKKSVGDNAVLCVKLEEVVAELNGVKRANCELKSEICSAQENAGKLNIDKSSLEQSVISLKESNRLLKDEKNTICRNLGDEITKVNNLTLQVTELEKSKTELKKELTKSKETYHTVSKDKKEQAREIVSLKAEKALAEKTLKSTQKTLNDKVKDAESARKVSAGALLALEKTVGELCPGDGKASVTAELPKDEAIRSYVAELESIRTAFKKKEEKIKKMMEAMETTKKKGMLGWISSAVAVVGFIAYTATKGRQ